MEEKVWVVSYATGRHQITIPAATAEDAKKKAIDGDFDNSEESYRGEITEEMILEVIEGP